jgi:hypothetical protein
MKTDPSLSDGKLPLAAMHATDGIAHTVLRSRIGFRVAPGDGGLGAYSPNGRQCTVLSEIDWEGRSFLNALLYRWRDCSSFGIVSQPASEEGERSRLTTESPSLNRIIRILARTLSLPYGRTRELHFSERSSRNGAVVLRSRRPFRKLLPLDRFNAKTTIFPWSHERSRRKPRLRLLTGHRRASPSRRESAWPDPNKRGRFRPGRPKWGRQVATRREKADLLLSDLSLRKRRRSRR